MAEATSYIGVRPVTVINDDNTNTLKRGTRVTRQADGHVNVQDATARGDYVLLTDVEPLKAGQASPATGGAKVPALAAAQFNVGDLLYSAASGKFTSTSTNAVLMGRCTLASSGNNVLGEVQLFETA